MDELGEWLQRLGLERYAGLFAAQGIGFELLPSLSDGDLKELGLPLGPRRIILREMEKPSSQAGSGARSNPTQGLRAAERRQLTLMFCDIVDSTPLSTRLDPEDLREVIGAYQQACSLPIKLFKGHIARYVGDGILVYFGYPVAHEDDAERAVRSGLGIVDAVARLSEKLAAQKGVHLAVRVGIATGLVVVGDIVGEDALERDAVVGKTPNLAARLQGVAKPNMVVVSQTTRQMAGAFSYLPMGEHRLKGIDEPVTLWQVVAETFASRLEARSAAPPTFVNRDQEMEFILQCWRRARAGGGQAVVISGEAGIGKSRLAVELGNKIATMERATGADPPRLLRFQCSPYHSNTALYPVIRLLEQLAALDRRDTVEIRLEKLRMLLQRAGREDGETPSLLADLCGIGRDHSGPDFAATARARRQRTIEALKDWSSSLAATGPLVIVFEDCQWIDPTSRLYLQELVDWAKTAPVLVIATNRTEPDGIGAGPGSERLISPASHVAHCELRQLDEGHTRQLIAAVAGKPLPESVLEALLQRSERIPLFAEELTIGLLESTSISELERNGDAIAPLTIPNTINEALMARLDQTGNARDIAQQAAVIGREFSVRLLSTMTGLPADELLDRLMRLEAASIINRSRLNPEIYFFRHALTRDVAYLSLLRGTRRELHLLLATEFEVNGANHADATDDLTAQHYSAGGAGREAIKWWQRAAKQAIARSAHEEAANMLRSAFREFKALGSAGSPDLELDLTLSSATALRSVRGYAAPEVEQLILRARALCAQSGDATNRFSVEWELFQCSIVKGDIDGASRIALGLFEHADHHPGRPRVDAFLADGMAKFHVGDFEGARVSFEQGLALCNPRTDEPHYFTHGQNAGLFCQSYLAHAYCFLGHMDRARNAIEQNLAIARSRFHQPAHVYSYVNALTFAVRVYQFLGNVAEVRRLAEELAAISRRSRYEYYEALATAHQGWATGEEGSAIDGIETMRRGLAALERTGTVLALPSFHLLLAQLYLRVGMRDSAADALALAAGPLGRGTSAWSAEVERVRGDILACGSPPDLGAAEAAYSLSVEIARQQQARALELRAAIGYSRLLRRRNRRQEGFDLLRGCLDRMPGGQSCEDVRIALALLKSLARDEAP